MEQGPSYAVHGNNFVSRGSYLGEWFVGQSVAMVNFWISEAAQDLSVELQKKPRALSCPRFKCQSRIFFVATPGC